MSFIIVLLSRAEKRIIGPCDKMFRLDHSRSRDSGLAKLRLDPSIDC